MHIGGKFCFFTSSNRVISLKIAELFNVFTHATEADSGCLFKIQPEHISSVGNIIEH